MTSHQARRMRAAREARNTSAPAGPVFRWLRGVVIATFVVAATIVVIDFSADHLSEPDSSQALTVWLDTENGSPFHGSEVQVDVATRREQTGTLLCVSAIYEFPDTVAASADLLAPDELPLIAIKGPPVLEYGNAPLSSAPGEFHANFRWRPQIDLDSVDWDPIPPGFPEDTMMLTLPTVHVYRPDTGTAAPTSTEESAFAYAGGCFVVDLHPSDSSGLASDTYTFQWGDREAQPVVSGDTDDTSVEWLFMQLPGDAVTSVRPATDAVRDGAAVQVFGYNETFRSDVVVSATQPRAFITVVYWLAAFLGGILVADLIRFIFKRGRLKRADETR